MFSIRYLLVLSFQMTRSDFRQSFANVFGRWAVSAGLGSIVDVQPINGENAVEIGVAFAKGAIVGYADERGISVAAIRNRECWDLLLSEDLSAEYGEAGWSCSQCLPPARAYFPSIEGLWEDHLFIPFREWTETKLLPARGLAYFGSDGITWAKLGDDDARAEYFHTFA